jgi:twitching motility protein PilT
MTPRLRDPNAPVETMFGLLELARRRSASDLHVDPGEGVALRIFTKIERVAGASADAGAIEAFLELVFDPLARARLDKLGMADAAYADGRVGSLRIHASRGRCGARLAIRLMPAAIPDIENLQLPDIVSTFSRLRSGLVLVCGPPGNGKTTTIVSLIARICSHSSRHVLTLETTIEHKFAWHASSIVSQYEVGRDVAGFAEGVYGALRADPNVIFIGELRERETVHACLQAAEAGYLVFAALHAPPESAGTIHRLVGLFPAEEQERTRRRLADTLRAVVGLRLLPLRDGTGLRPAAEILVGNDAVRRIIRDGSVHQLRSQLASSRREGMQTLETALSQLVAEGAIDLAEARAVSQYPDEIQPPPLAQLRR